MAQATIRDVAREAGVSVASVSRVMNRLPNVRPELKEKVEAAARRLDYVPHVGARSLSLARTGVVGVVLPDLHGEFFSEILRGMDREAASRGLQLLLSNIHADPRSAIEALRTLRGRVDGLVVMAPHIDPSTLFAHLPESIPAVLLNCPDNLQGRAELRTDNVAGAAAMVAHLAAIGRRHILHIAGPTNNAEARQRLAGYEAAVAEAGLEPIVIQGNFDEESGRAAIATAIRRRATFDAVFAANDIMAIGAMMALRDAGFVVPDDVAVAGFDNVPLARLISPPLTTMAIDIADLGGRAINRLWSILDGGDVPSMELRRPTLIIRASTQVRSV